ncbi:hypothetical protein [Salinisphaera sp. LB1]|uniref:hypothetical protein n=1 Tax=Salinisphaera sp. LB1 TaxID=2183911 RepID=UPI000D705BFB|nr:hypothetical protein [Salinisphaera sp. LB1]AWN14809.1 Cytochrome O ubiquinol oxidase subunit IV [Salinisphaera sp. LB1]
MAEHDHHDPLAHPEVQQASTGRYVAAFVLALVALLISCIVTAGFDLSRDMTIAWISILAAIAATGQVYLLFNLNLSKAMRWHTAAFVLTAPLVLMAIGLTLFMFHYLMIRTTAGG